ncbi:flavin reductase family protein [Chloroflexi bacterium TSY]|nr:flavin reductase family protein [Chloroflexi bacterium TSY]
MILHPSELEDHDADRLLAGSIVPCPIVWVSSMDLDGRLNLAPFSHFTFVCIEPMTLLFCSGVPSSSMKNRDYQKDTVLNIKAVPEFVINLTNEETTEAINLGATDLLYGRSDFDWARGTPAASHKIQVPRIAEASVAFECTLQQIVTISQNPGGGSAIFGEVQCIHVQDAY